MLSARFHHRLLLIVGSLSVLMVFWFVLKPGSSFFFRASDDLLRLLGALGGAALCFWGMLIPELPQHARRGACWMGCGLSSWSMGQGLWIYQEVILHHLTPFPSWLDPGFLGLYAGLVIGILLLFTQPMPAALRLRLIGDGVITTVAVALVEWVFILGPTIEQQGGALFKAIIAMAFPVGDLALFLTSTLLVAQLTVWRRMPFFSCLVIGCASIFVADIVFDYQSIQGTYLTGSIIDVGWPLGFLFLGLATAQFCASMPKITIQRVEQIPRWVLIIPALLVLLAQGYVFIVYLHHIDGLLEKGVLVGNGMLIVLATIRQMLLFTEITRLQRSVQKRNTELTGMHNQLAEAYQAKSRFLANMSHDLRTPLNSIIGFADVLHSGEAGDITPLQEDFLNDILISGRHLLSLITDILDLSKIEAGKLDFAPEAIDLPAFLADVCAIIRPLATSKSIHLKTTIAADLVTVILDPVRLKQVAVNYLSNAIKFTPEGGSVTMRLMTEGVSQWRLEVEDTGIGIATEQIPQLFVEFQQLDASSSKQYQGMGLGLALTKRLVEGQGGLVGVRSVLGSGSIFWAILPRSMVSASSRSAVLSGRS